MTYAISHQRWADDARKELYRSLNRSRALEPLHEMVNHARTKKRAAEESPEWFIALKSSWAEPSPPESEDETYTAFVKSVSLLTESRDPYTAGHQVKVSELAEGIAREMGLPADMIKGIKVAGVVHDIGKLSVPAEIVTKPGALSPLEFSIIKEHPRKAFEVLNEIDFPWPVAETVLQHHERLDGSGYPLGLKGTDIRLEARVLAVADVVGAISSHRPYRRNLGIEAAIMEIDTKKGVFYDADVTRACRRSLKGSNRWIADA
ncbi:MAG: HD-GYP domain-containing protein [Deltaproteobacteria bacterium]